MCNGIDAQAHLVLFFVYILFLITSFPYFTHIQRILVITTVFVTKDFAVKSKLLLKRNLASVTDTFEHLFL